MRICPHDLVSLVNFVVKNFRIVDFGCGHGRVESFCPLLFETPRLFVFVSWLRLPAAPRHGPYVTVIVCDAAAPTWPKPSVNWNTMVRLAVDIGPGFALLNEML